MIYEENGVRNEMGIYDMIQRVSLYVFWEAGFGWLRGVICSHLIDNRKVDLEHESHGG